MGDYLPVIHESMPFFLQFGSFAIHFLKFLEFNSMQTNFACKMKMAMYHHEPLFYKILILEIYMDSAYCMQ